MDFCSLQHLQALTVHRSQAIQACDVPPSGFGYPHDGLLPRVPGRLCFAPAALMGFTLRSFLLPPGTRRVLRDGWTHLPFFLPGAAPRSARTERPRFLGFDPAGNPSPVRRCLADPPTGYSPGFRPFQGSSAGAFGGRLPAYPLARFGRCLATAATRLRVSFDPDPATTGHCKQRAVTATLIGFLCLIRSLAFERAT